MPEFQLQVGAAAFWADAAAAIAVARRRVLVQAMTFEGDAAGLAVARAVAASPAAERRVRVDAYSRRYVSDRPVSHARRDQVFATEVAATAEMFARLPAQGVEVRWTAPFRSLWRDAPFRDHRKIVVADDAAWIGGVNFSDHNFAWPDLMLRMDRADIADALAADFARPASTLWRAELRGVTLLGLDGRSNPKGFAAVMALIDGARRAIEVMSPYLTDPFTSALGRAAARGVRVRVVTPEGNNKPVVRDALRRASRRLGLELHLTPGMSHAKAMVADGETLVLGSSNFDFASYRAEAEIVGLFTDPALIAEVQARVLEPAFAAGVRAAGGAGVRGLAAEAALNIADGYVRLLARLR